MLERDPLNYQVTLKGRGAGPVESWCLWREVELMCEMQGGGDSRQGEFQRR